MMDSRKVNIWMVFGLEYHLFRFMRRRLYRREDNQEMDTSSQVNATDSSLHVPCPCRSWHCYPLGFHDTTCFRLFSFLSGCYFSSPMALLFLCLSILRILSDRFSALASALLTSSFCSFTLGNFIYSQGFNYICISRVLKPPLHPSPGPKCPTSSSNSTLPNTKPLSYHFLPPINLSQVPYTQSINGTTICPGTHTKEWGTPDLPPPTIFSDSDCCLLLICLHTMSFFTLQQEKPS